MYSKKLYHSRRFEEFFFFEVFFFLNSCLDDFFHGLASRLEKTFKEPGSKNEWPLLFLLENPPVLALACKAKKNGS